MPTVLRVGPYRFFFYSGDRTEPLHIHVEREGKIAKFWLDPVRLHKSGGLNSSEIGRIRHIIDQHHKLLVEAWHEYFNG